MEDSSASPQRTAGHLPIRFTECNGIQSDGRLCGQMASIDAAADVVDSAGRVVETRYVIICPKCGRRLKSVWADQREAPDT